MPARTKRFPGTEPRIVENGIAQVPVEKPKRTRNPKRSDEEMLAEADRERAKWLRRVTDAADADLHQAEKSWTKASPEAQQSLLKALGLAPPENQQ